MALIFDSSCAGLTRASIKNMIQLNAMDCRVNLRRFRRLARQ
jgi:hypothetical protein